ncbi:MAG: hypothetical protein JXQ30_07845 [Spirochaetes bacterium]|nr:hypothetical protein [Spirochaetota bacterium]
MRKIITTAILFLLLVPGTGCGRREHWAPETPTVSGSILSEGPFTIGDPIDILYTVIADRQGKVGFPQEEELFAPFTVRGFSQKRSRVAKDTYKTIAVYTVAVFETGTVTFPSLPVKIEEQVLNTEPLQIHILSVLPKDEEAHRLKEIVPPYRPRTRRSTVLIVFGSIIAACGIGYFLYRFVKSKKRGRPDVETQAASDPDPYGRSIEALERVRAGFIKDSIGTKQAYSELSLIMRLFIGSIMRFNASRMTTNQLARYLKRDDFPIVPQRRFLGLLKKSDLVKFAKDSPEKGKVVSDVDESIGIVREVHDAIGKRDEKEGGGD